MNLETLNKIIFICNNKGVKMFFTKRYFVRVTYMIGNKSKYINMILVLKNVDFDEINLLAIKNIKSIDGEVTPTDLIIKNISRL